MRQTPTFDFAEITIKRLGAAEDDNWRKNTLAYISDVVRRHFSIDKWELRGCFRTGATDADFRRGTTIVIGPADTEPSIEALKTCLDGELASSWHFWVEPHIQRALGYARRAR